MVSIEARSVGPMFVRLSANIRTSDGVLPVTALIRPESGGAFIADLKAAADECEPDLRPTRALKTLRAALEGRGWVPVERDAASLRAYCILRRREQRSEGR